MRSKMLAFVCVAAFAACSSNPKTDGGTQDLSNGGQDLTVVPPDMAKKPGPSCGAVLFGGKSGTTSPASSKALIQALLDCYASACGFMATATDDFSLSPCQDMSGDRCNTCISNSNINCDIPLITADMAIAQCAYGSDGCPKSGGVCSGSTTIAGLCGPQAGACILDCNVDQDCTDAGISCNGGATVVCDLDGSITGTAHQCGCM